MIERASSLRALWAPLLAVGLLSSAGCTKRVPLEPPISGRVGGGTVFVQTLDGAEYRFSWAEIQDSTLTGHYRIEQEVSRDGLVEVIEADRALPLRMSQVQRIEAKRFDLEKTLFLAGGAAVAGYFIQTLLPEDAEKPPGNGGGKPLPGM